MSLSVELSKTQMAIITLLRAEDINKVKYSSIPGKTHLVKELFAIQKTTLGQEILTELKFEPDNFGPFDETIYAALDSLANVGYVKLDFSAKRRVNISLTPKGRILSDEIWGKVRDDIKSLFTYVKINYNHLSSEKLLEKIYSAYPEMAKFSKAKIANKYRPKESM